MKSRKKIKKELFFFHSKRNPKATKARYLVSESKLRMAFRSVIICASEIFIKKKKKIWIFSGKKDVLLFFYMLVNSISKGLTSGKMDIS